MIFEVLPYTYIVTNNITGEYYYGSRYRNKEPAIKDLGIKYKTSSKEIKKQIKEFGLESFTFTVLFEGIHDVDSYYWYEQLLIREHIKDPKCLNQQYLDPDINSKKWSMAGVAHSAATKAKQSKPKSEEHRKKLKESNQAKAQDPNYIAKLRKPKIASHGANVSAALKGVPKTKEHCKSMSDVRKGKKTGPCTDSRRSAIQESLRGKRTLEGKPTDPLGKTYEELHGVEKALELKKLRSAHMRKIRATDTEITCPHCGQISKSKANMKRWHFNNCKKRK